MSFAEIVGSFLGGLVGNILKGFLYAVGFYILFLMVGCSTVAGGDPYFDVGAGYQLDSRSDWYVRTGREWQCEQNLQAHFELGVQWDNTTLGYHHQSWYACGGPFWNGRPELYQDDIRLTYRFGGKK